MEYVLLLVGFFLLIKGADWFVDGSSSLAKFLRVPSAIIGLTIVAFGTSAPELSVSVTAGLSGQNEIAISNVLGSNLFNLLVVTGVCAIIAAVPVNRNIIRRELPLSIAAAVMLLIFCLTGNTVGRIEGILFLAVFAWFLFRQIKEALSSRHEAPSDPMEQVISPVKSIILIVIGWQQAMMQMALVRLENGDTAHLAADDSKGRIEDRQAQGDDGHDEGYGSRRLDQP